MLDHIYLNNFKAARDLDLPLAALTMLAGLNGSGKSTVLQSLAAIRQSYQAGQSHGMQLGGPLVALGRGMDVLSEGAKDETITVAVRDGDMEYRWVCKVLPESNQLEFIKSPSTLHGFVTNPNFQYLQADRIVPRTLYPQADQQARQGGSLGSNGEFTVDFLASNGDQPVSEKRRCVKDYAALDDAMWAKIAPTHQLLDQVAGWLQQISPGARLRVELLKGTDEVILQFQYVGQARGMEPRFNRPTHVGFGLTYSLPILVACLAAPAGSLLLIENPEAHLHPQGQAKMGELLGLCAADGVQVLVETHSDHLLNGIRLAVKKGSLLARDVRLCYFTRDLSSGDCFVELPSVLPDGQLTNWPEGFFDQWEKSLDSLLD
jgi:predicted ATPase